MLNSLWSGRLELYLGIYEEQLRYFTPQGELVLLPEEAAKKECQEKELAQQQIETERQQRELAQRQIEQLKAQLRALGVEPEQSI